MKDINQYLQIVLNKIYLELINTGERPMLETIFERINAVYQFSYIFASDLVKNKSVLDFGCGGGYGTEYLSRFTKQIVTGFDIDKRTIEINDKYFNKGNLMFISNQKMIKEYDIVVSFQVIEHLKEKFVEDYLNNISKKYLKQRGIFICSTPNKLITSTNLKKPIMVFHEKEYGPIELRLKLKKYFKNVSIFGQGDEFIINTKKNRDKERKVSTREKLIKKVSQIEIVRIISRHLPMAIKYLFEGNPKKDKEINYKLVDNSEEIDKSYILIAKCEN